MGCHLSGLCNDETITIQAISTTECCDMGGRSFNDGLECLPACGAIGKVLLLVDTSPRPVAGF